MVRRAGLESAHCGLLVREVDSGDVCLALNAERLFVPASTLKLLTTYASLLRFGPDHRFATTLWVSKEGTDSGTAQTVVLRGGGDPFLADKEWDNAVPSPFTSLISGLKARGITQIGGDVLVDASLFGDRMIPDDWSSGDRGKFYAAPISSISVGHNVIIADIRPGPSLGKSAAVRILPDLPSYIALRTNALTAPRRARSVTARLRLSGDTLDVSGAIGIARESARLAVAVQDPATYAGRWFAHSLALSGITVEGDVRATYEPMDYGDYEIVATHQSDPLSEIVKRILHESDNLGAECLARHVDLGQSSDFAESSPGEEPEAPLLQILRNRGFPGDPPAKITDGSGLSRTNLLAPVHLAWVLTHAAGEDEFDFPATFPRADDHAGFEKHPMSPEHGNRVAAKTGSFQNTRCLAGYYFNEQGDPAYAFAIMVNGLAGSSDPAIDFETLVIDEISRIASRGGR